MHISVWMKYDEVIEKTFMTNLKSFKQVTCSSCRSIQGDPDSSRSYFIESSL